MYTAQFLPFYALYKICDFFVYSFFENYVFLVLKFIDICIFQPTYKLAFFV